jgi:hypothetical protein
MTRKVIIKTQKEYDDLDKNFNEFTDIEIRSDEIIIIREAYGNSRVTAYSNSTIEAYSNSRVRAYDNSTVEAYSNSTIEAYSNSRVRAYDNSRVTAFENSTVKAYSNSRVKAYDNSRVTAYSNSTIEAYSNSRVRAYGNSTIEAYSNSTIEAYSNSRVKAYDNSRVTAFENSTVKAYLKSVIRYYSGNVKVYDNVTVYNYRDNTFEHEDSVNVISEFIEPTFEQWLERGIVYADGIYKNLISTKKQGEITVYVVEGGYVVKRGDSFSHGETLKQAIEDLRYKLSDRDTSKYESWSVDDVKTTDEIIQAYRAITGACEQGTKDFCKGLNLKDEYKISEIIEITENAYRGDTFRDFINK